MEDKDSFVLLGGLTLTLTLSSNNQNMQTCRRIGHGLHSRAAPTWRDNLLIGTKLCVYAVNKTKKTKKNDNRISRLDASLDFDGQHGNSPPLSCDAGRRSVLAVEYVRVFGFS